jgi:hypothetical protein
MTVAHNKMVQFMQQEHDRTGKRGGGTTRAAPTILLMRQSRSGASTKPVWSNLRFLEKGKVGADESGVDEARGERGWAFIVSE